MDLWSFLKTSSFITKMMFRLPGIVFSYYSKRRKAMKVFKRELIESGIPPNEAEDLLDDYPFKLSEIIQLARNIQSTRHLEN